MNHYKSTNFTRWSDKFNILNIMRSNVSLFSSYPKKKIDPFDHRRKLFLVMNLFASPRNSCIPLTELLSTLKRMKRSENPRKLCKYIGSWNPPSTQFFYNSREHIRILHWEKKNSFSFRWNLINPHYVSFTPTTSKKSEVHVFPKSSQISKLTFSHCLLKLETTKI